MNVRALEQKDLAQIKEIHEKYYKNEFNLPDFFNNFLCCFVVENDGRIISAGGVKPIAEAIIVTDKDIKLWERLKALDKVLDVSSFIASNFKYPQIHAFVEAGPWEQMLRKAGFKDCKGKPLFLNI